MKNTRTRRTRVVGVGVLLASVISLGISTGTASATRSDKTSDPVVVEGDINGGITSTSLRAGIRW